MLSRIGLVITRSIKAWTKSQEINFLSYCSSRSSVLFCRQSKPVRTPRTSFDKRATLGARRIRGHLDESEVSWG